MAKIEAGFKRKPMLGDRIRIINAAFGAHGVNGEVGVVTSERSTNGVLDTDRRLMHIRLDSGEVWAVGRPDEVMFVYLNDGPEDIGATERTLSDPPEEEQPTEESGMERHEVMIGPGDAKPMVSAEDYAKGRAVLDALPPGIYAKCAVCSRWQRGGAIQWIDQVLHCEKCYDE